MDKPPALVKKDRFIIIFYVLYFGWLLLTTYLSRDDFYNNLLISFVVMIYFIFLNETFDLFLFLVITLLSYYLMGKLYGYPGIEFTLEYIKTMPLWIYISWGFTAVALKKLFSMIIRRVEI